MTIKLNELIKTCYNNNVLILMSGLPGSGKTTIAARIMYELKRFNPRHSVEAFSADTKMYLNSEDYTYKFDPTLLGLAHKICYDKAAAHMSLYGITTIIDNTNLTMWEINKYVDNFLKNKHVKNKVIVFAGNENINPKEAFVRNSHEVPFEKLEEMHKKYQTMEEKKEKILKEYPEARIEIYA